jgi:hypothetical protein
MISYHVHADPEQYLQRAEKPEKSDSKLSSQSYLYRYICPMHPELTGMA